jgi:hypothetical protein
VTYKQVTVSVDVEAITNIYTHHLWIVKECTGMSIVKHLHTINHEDGCNLASSVFLPPNLLIKYLVIPIGHLHIPRPVLTPSARPIIHFFLPSQNYPDDGEYNTVVTV